MLNAWGYIYLVIGLGVFSIVCFLFVLSVTKGAKKND